VIERLFASWLETPLRELAEDPARVARKHDEITRGTCNSKLRDETARFRSGGGSWDTKGCLTREPRSPLPAQEVAKLAPVEFPPMQAPASFNLEAVKREIEEKIKAHAGQ